MERRIQEDKEFGVRLRAPSLAGEISSRLSILVSSFPFMTTIAPVVVVIATAARCGREDSISESEFDRQFRQ